MPKIFKTIPGSITAPKGFLASGVFCDIKRLGTGKGSQKGKKRDLALIISEVPATVAGMFTTNQVCAAPVKICIERVRHGVAQALVVNSGNANACTSEQGLRDARQMTAMVAQQFSLPDRHVLVGSTGRIGVPMPMRNVQSGILQASALLGHGPEHAAEAAEAIMTSDTRAKQIAVELTMARSRVRIGGICKGAGMIQPGLSATGRRPPALPLHATMLCFVTSDAAIKRAPLRAALREAVARSFNRITVDGDMSTNDTVLVLANGLAGNPVIASDAGREFEYFQEALSYVTLELAKMIVRDGEGVSRLVTVRVNGAQSHPEADVAARAVSNSALVKTSWCGGDPNWGRIIDALGYSAATVVENKVNIAYSPPGSRRLLYSLRAGRPTGTPFAALCKIAALPEFDLHIDLNLGQGSAVMYAADLTEDYVDFNKGDVTDPASLGG
jgi:glutamate N-acetyltransferase / amino-acid N-acetyltransferase